MAYNNTVLSITDIGTPDPFVIRAHGKYFLTFTCGWRVEIWSADTLEGFHQPQIHGIWQPPPDTDHSDALWAPELHDFQGRWYVYFAAGHPAQGNASHRMWVLGGPPSSQDPCTGGNWEFLGPIQGLHPQQWAIDGTLFSLDSGYYFCYSGWPLHNPNNSDLVQQLFIVRMVSATATDGHPPVMISKPEHRWEWTDDHGINEGPQWLASPDESWRGLTYSCAGSWTNQYKMATLKYVGGDPLSPRAWQKSSKPLITTAPHGKGPWAPGHGSWLKTDNGELIGVYHATDSPTDGWENRKARVQRVVFGRDGPYMGGEVGPMTMSIQQFQSGVSGGNSSQQQPMGEHGHGKLHGLFSQAKAKLREL